MMKQADAVRCAQAEWKEGVATNQERYTAALQKAAKYLKQNRLGELIHFSRYDALN